MQLSNYVIEVTFFISCTRNIVFKFIVIILNFSNLQFSNLQLSNQKIEDYENLEIKYFYEI